MIDFMKGANEKAILDVEVTIWSLVFNTNHNIVTLIF